MELWKRFGRGLSRRCGIFRLRTDVGSVMRALAALSDKELSEKIKVRFSVRTLFCPLSAAIVSLMPSEKRAAALEKALKLLDAHGGAGKESGGGKKLLSLFKDCDMIYCALLQTYGIDMLKQKTDFRLLPMLIAGADETSLLQRAIGIRAAEIPPPNASDSEFAKRLKKLKEIYSIEEKKQSLSEGLEKTFEFLKNADTTDSVRQ